MQGRPNRSAKVDAGISRRLGLEVDDRNRRICSTTSKLILPKELPSIEEALQMLAGVMKAAVKSKPWTREEEKELRSLAESGVSVSRIVKNMSKTCAAAVKKRERLGQK